MGVAFNSQLTDTVSKNKGSNYFCVTDEAQLRQCLLEDFTFNFFPCAFEINVYIRSGSWTVQRVFGTPFETTEQENLSLRWSPKTDALYPEETRKHASRLSQHLPAPLVNEVVSNLPPPKQSVTEINTLFPSRLREDGAMKGGLILVQLEAAGGALTEGRALQVTLEYEDLQGMACNRTQDISIANVEDHYCTPDLAIQQSLQKGLLLQKYAQMCRRHMDLVNKTAIDPDLELEKQNVHEMLRAVGGLQVELDSWKRRSGQFVGDDKMETVMKTYEAFAGIVERAVVDRQKELAKREEWERERPQREARIAEERAAWEVTVINCSQSTPRQATLRSLKMRSPRNGA